MQLYNALHFLHKFSQCCVVIQQLLCFLLVILKSLTLKIAPSSFLLSVDV